MKDKPEEVKFDESKCQSCQKAEASELHICPYASDIHDDQETLCNCCGDCEHECAMDI